MKEVWEQQVVFVANEVKEFWLMKN